MRQEEYQKSFINFREGGMKTIKYVLCLLCVFVFMVTILPVFVFAEPTIAEIIAEIQETRSRDPNRFEHGRTGTPPVRPATPPSIRPQPENGIFGSSNHLH